MPGHADSLHCRSWLRYHLWRRDVRLARELFVPEPLLRSPGPNIRKSPKIIDAERVHQDGGATSPFKL